MCGIFGVVAARDRTLSISIERAERLRDSLEHRGPDGAGTWHRDGAILTHRRLAVIDPSPAGAQPFVSDDGRFVLVYNGEIYNDADLRRELATLGARFRTHCDTETLLRAIEMWGLDALPRIRGMFAFALWDTRERLLTLARDPLGVKPLYLTVNEREVAFASEPSTLARMPGFSARPNMAMVSAYLSTIRTVLGNDTLFEDVLALAPGQLAQCDLSGASPIARVLTWWQGPRSDGDVDEQVAAERVRRAMTDSVRAHLRADVPTCCLLSGGLDSTITTFLAAKDHASLRTYCAGARRDDGGEVESMFAGDDLSFARDAASFLGTDHAEAIVTRERFAERWPWMIDRLGVPLSTPNEVAIHAVASRLREDGCVVTLSGEGADELFAGYEGPMLAAADFVAKRAACETSTGGGRFELESNAWAPPAMKELLLTPGAWRAAGHDEPLFGLYDAEFRRAAHEACGDEDANAVDAHLRFHRRVNLTGLLQRLDTATMLASVEGRTPFADIVVAELAESLPIRAKFAVHALAGVGAEVEQTYASTKIALREAFRADLPAPIVERPKASFPLPFQAWVGDHAGALRSSEFARSVFSEAVVEVVVQDPTRNWRLAWPMVNIALWGRKWWG